MLNINDNFEVGQQIVWGTELEELWSCHIDLMKTLPPKNQNDINEAREMLYNSSYFESAVSAIKRRAPNPTTWDTSRHLTGEHPEILKFFRLCRKDIRAFLTDVSKTFNLDFIEHPSIKRKRKKSGTPQAT